MDGIVSLGYAAILGLLVASGLGLPFPEEATQIAAGVLAHQQVLELWKVMIVAWCGIVAGDSILFFLGRRHGERLLSSRALQRVVTPARRERLRVHFDHHAFLTVVVARHLSGVRGAVFALAGVHGVPYRTVLLGDGLSALISVPLTVGLGFLFSRHVLQLERDMRVVQGVILALLLLAAVLAWLRVRRRAIPAQ